MLSYRNKRLIVRFFSGKTKEFDLTNLTLAGVHNLIHSIERIRFSQMEKLARAKQQAEKKHFFFENNPDYISRIFFI